MFKEGARIRLLSMPDDPDPVPVGSLGTVEMVVPCPWDKTAQVHVKWDNGRTLSMIVPPDVAEEVK